MQNSNLPAIQSVQSIAPKVRNATTHGPFSIPEMFGVSCNADLAQKLELPPGNVDCFLTNSGWWRGINFICDKVAGTPLEPKKVLPTGGSETDKKHDAYKLLRRQANPFMTASEWKRVMTFHALAVGNGCSFINRDPQNRITDLILLDPYSVAMYVITEETEIRIVTNEGIEVTKTIAPGFTFYRALHGGKNYTLSSDQVFHLKGLSFNGVWGLPVLEYAKYTIEAANVARDFGHKFFRGGANPSFVVYYPRGLEEDLEDKWLKDVKDALVGLHQSHAVIPLYNDAKIERLTVDQESAQFLETRQFSLREIANLLGLPASSLNAEGSFSYNSLEIAKDAELEGVDPWLVRWEDESFIKLNSMKQQEDESHFFEFSREEIRRIEYDRLIDTDLKELREGGISLNEYRSRRRRPATNEPNADRFRMSANTIFMDEVTKENREIADGERRPNNIALRNRDDEDDQDDRMTNEIQQIPVTSPSQTVLIASFRDLLDDVARRSFARISNALGRAAKNRDGLVKYLSESIQKDRTYFVDRCQVVYDAYNKISDKNLTANKCVGNWLAQFEITLLIRIREEEIDDDDLREPIQNHIKEYLDALPEYLFPPGE